jgi:hypothetical protein
MWLVEEIPNEDFLFLRVHKNLLNFGESVPKGVFRDQGDGMSTDWDKYSTAEQTQQRAKRSPAADNGVLKLNVGGIRAIASLSVQHEPLPDNRAHTEVFGEKNPKARVLLQRLAEWVIPFST